MKYLKLLLKIIFDGILLLLSIIGILIFLLWKDTWNPYSHSIDDSLIPTYTKYNLDETHVFNGETSLPMRGSTLIDINNDGIDEIFLGGGSGQNDAVYSYENDDFIDVSQKYNITKGDSENTLAAASADIDGNGFSDLLVSRDDTLTIYYNENGVFQGSIINTHLESDTSPLGLALGDIDKDGDIDMYISGYIKRAQMNGLTNFSEGYGGTSALLINDGAGNFENKTQESGLSYVHNTFQGIFIDLDNDSWLDLVVAHDTGEPRIYKNNTDGTFAIKEHPFSGKFAYPMGIAIGDYNNDGYSDIMFSNIGSTLPKALVKGDLPNSDDLELGWFLLKNNGDFNFEDTAEQASIQDYEFSWGSVFADMNNDGREDLLVAENYVDLSFQKIFKLPGRFLLQRDDGIFVAAGKESGAGNKYYGITPLISDFNKDGSLDIVWVNIAGPSYALIAEKNTIGNFLQISFRETAENIGTKVRVTLPSGEQVTQDYIIGEGLAGDQSPVLHFGLGNSTQIQSVEVIPSHTNASYFLETPEINTFINID